MNNVNVIGRATKDPELRYIANSGTAVCNFNIAIDKGLSRAKKEEFEQQGKPTADFINVVAWSGTAEFVANYLRKGKLVGVSGSLESGKYQDKDGKTVYTTDVRAFNIDILEWPDDNEAPKQDSSKDGFPDIDGFDPVDDANIPF